MTEQQDKACAIYQVRSKDGKHWSEVSKPRFDFYQDSTEIGVEVRILYTAPPSVEALTKEVEELQRENSSRCELHRVVVAANKELRTTNAAQAEQLAAVEAKKEEWRKLCLQYDAQRMMFRDLLQWVDKYVSCALSGSIKEAVSAPLPALLQSSIPPEPQAGLELTEEDVERKFAEQWFYSGQKSYRAHCREWFVRGMQCALNQRQAVKAEPKIIGAIVSLDVSTGDENFGDRIYGRVFAIQDDVLLVEETGRNFKPEPLSAAHGVPEGMVTKRAASLSFEGGSIRINLEGYQHNGSGCFGFHSKDLDWEDDYCTVKVSATEFAEIQKWLNATLPTLPAAPEQAEGKQNEA
jgi:hypothetical protein